MATKVISRGFSRFVGTGEFVEEKLPTPPGEKQRTRRVERERRQEFAKGRAITAGEDGVSEDDIKHWLAIDLVEAVAAPSAPSPAPAALAKPTPKAAE